LAARFISFSFFKEGEWLSNFRGTECTWATFNFRDTVRVFANKFALGFRASGFMTFPVTFGFFADWFAFWFRCLIKINIIIFVLIKVKYSL
jgi:hypothetical protein